MKVDFFVHPEHPALTGYPITEEYNKYLEELIKIQEQSSRPILIEGLEKGNFSKRFTTQHTLQSNSFYIIDYPCDYGEIIPQDWEKLEGLVSKEDEIRVHGAFLGECTEGFAVQLFAYLNKGLHWHNWRGTPKYNKEEYEEERRLIKKYEKNGDFRNSQIRFGTVMAPNRKKRRIIKPSRISFFGLKYGNITYQLIDSLTKIYKSKTRSPKAQ